MDKEKGKYISEKHIKQSLEGLRMSMEQQIDNLRSECIARLDKAILMCDLLETKEVKVLSAPLVTEDISSVINGNMRTFKGLWLMSKSDNPILYQNAFKRAMHNMDLTPEELTQYYDEYIQKVANKVRVE
jgi:hypothetical protein